MNSSTGTVYYGLATHYMPKTVRDFIDYLISNYDFKSMSDAELIKYHETLYSYMVVDADNPDCCICHLHDLALPLDYMREVTAEYVERGLA